MFILAASKGTETANLLHSRGSLSEPYCECERFPSFLHSLLFGTFEVHCVL